MRKVQIDLVRVAGEMGISIETGPDSRIVEVGLHPYSSVRGFETLVKGRGFTFAVPAVMRICGVCHAVQGTAVCEAIEGALGIRPPREGLLLREACILANRLQSHFFQHFLVIPDLLPRRAVEELQRDALIGLDKASTLLQILGGTATHPSRLTVGGIAQGLTPKAREKAAEVVAEIGKLVSSFGERFEASLEESPLARELAETPFSVAYLATDPFYGNSARINPGLIGSQEPSGNALPVLYAGRPVEAGPRARLVKFFGFDDISLLGVQLARLRELALTVGRLQEILQEIDPQAPVRLPEIPLRAGAGVGVVEAPRGTLVHLVELDAEGRVLSLRIFTPTQFNFAALREVLPGAPARMAEVAVRIYDPCIPCVVH